MHASGNNLRTSISTCDLQQLGINDWVLHMFPRNAEQCGMFEYGRYFRGDTYASAKKLEHV